MPSYDSPEGRRKQLETLAANELGVTEVTLDMVGFPHSIGFRVELYGPKTLTQISNFLSSAEVPEGLVSVSSDSYYDVAHTFLSWNE